MLAIAIKNTIIVILIILIIHFLIKTLSPQTSDSKQDKMESLVPPPMYPEGYQAIQDGTTLDNAFGNTKEDFTLKPEEPSTCDPLLDPKESDKKTVESECVLDQPNPNAFLLLKQYENENQMNNSKWIDNVDLYDEFGDRFSEYACADEKNVYK